jgi:hypothetical protein
MQLHLFNVVFAIVVVDIILTGEKFLTMYFKQLYIVILLTFQYTCIQYKEALRTYGTS